MFKSSVQNGFVKRVRKILCKNNGVIFFSMYDLLPTAVLFIVFVKL